MNRKRTLLALLITALLITPMNARGAGGEGRTIEGTWQVIVNLHVPDSFPIPNLPSSFEALETYGRGGGLITSNNMAFLTRVGQGTWDKTGNQYFAKIKFFTFDPSGLPLGEIIVTHTVVLNGDDLYTGTGRASLCGPGETDCVTVDFDTVGRRLRAEP